MARYGSRCSVLPVRADSERGFGHVMIRIDWQVDIEGYWHSKARTIMIWSHCRDFLGCTVRIRHLGAGGSERIRHFSGAIGVKL